MAPGNLPYDVVKVKYSGGAYVTSTVRGFRASCTSGAHQAVDRLGQKLYGGSALFGVRAAPESEPAADCTTYHLFAPEAS